MSLQAEKNKVTLTIPFLSSTSASLAYDVLNVDKDLKRSGIRKELSLDGVNILVNFYGAEFKRLRVAVNAFLNNVILVAKTLHQFEN